MVFRLGAGVLALAGAVLSAVAALSGEHEVDVVVPSLAGPALEGQAVFAQHCAECHGAAAGGTEKGPPLVHPIYNPGHHGDMAFVLAAQQGVRAHHWGFGDMPAVPDVTEKDLFLIIRYVRTLQEANGIE